MAEGNGSAPREAPDLLLAETLCARLCDAVGGLTTATPRLAARLGLLRAAWVGPAAPLDAAALRVLAAGLPDGVRLDPGGLDKAARFPPAPGRLVLNALLLAVEALPGGGTVTLSGGADSVVLVPDGPGAAWPPGVAARLAGTAPDARDQVQAWLVRLLAVSIGARANLLLGRADAGPPPLLLTF